MSEDSPIRSWLKLWPWLAAVLTGVLTTLCFAPFEQTWLCWLALTPLLAAVWFSGEGMKRRWLRDLLLGYVAGVVFFWGVFSWLHTVTVPGLILVGLYMGVYFAIWSWLAGLVRPRISLPAPEARRNVWPAVQPNELPGETRSPWLSSLHNLWLAFILAAGWTGLEWVRSWMFSGWGWNGLGIPLHDILPIIQIAEITGVAGLSFVVAFANVIGVATVRRFHASRARCGCAGRITISPLPWRRSSAFAVTESGSCKCRWRRNRSELQRSRPMCRGTKNLAARSRRKRLPNLTG